MNENATDRQNDADVSPREHRALTQSMTVSRGSEPGEFDVYNIDGKRYVVNLIKSECTCPDYERRGVVCKHQHRVMFETGQKEIPAGYERCDAVAMREARVRVSERRAARQAPEPVAMADGGVVSEPEPRGETDEDTPADDSDGSDDSDESDACLCEVGDSLPCATCYIHHGVRGEVTEVRR